MEELKACVEDFPHFAQRYLKIHRYTTALRAYCPQGCANSLAPFELYPFQVSLAGHCEDNRFTLVKKFRCGGFTTFAAGYMLWNCLFRLDQNVMFLARSDRAAVEIGYIVQTMIANLPQWLRPAMSKCNDHTKRFDDTNSQMQFHTPEAACGKSVDWLVLDEAALIADMDSHWKAMCPTLSCGGRCLVLSTPQGKKGWFYDAYTQAEDGSQQHPSNWSVFKCSFKEHPDYNNVDWAVQTMKNLGLDGWRQEVEAEFL